VENISKNNLIRLSKSSIGIAEKAAVAKVLDDEYLGMGSKVQEFEKILTGFFGRQAICVSSGTSALHLALQAANIGPGDEVLVQSLTYVSSFQAIAATGAKPIACDVDSTTLCLDWKDAEFKITSNTKAIMPVHYSGGVGSLNKIYDLAHKYNLRVIEDAAHAFGTEYQDSKIGGFGDIACFSFDGIKNITSGEGGCVVSDDQEVLRKVRDARLLGVEKDSEKRYMGNRSWEFEVSLQGWRYHMSNIMAAIGIEQFKRFESFKQKRKKFAKMYNELFSENDKINPLAVNYDMVVPHIYVVLINSQCDREKIRKYLLEKGIQTGVHYQPNHLLSAFFCNHNNHLPTTELIYPKLLSLPLHPDLHEENIGYVAKFLIECTKDNFFDNLNGFN
jgi:dTDP-4-amino-4,6-dideoxygalactose transaminase